MNDIDDSRAGKLSLDACLELLSSRQRRAIVRFFVESGSTQAPLDEIISAIVDEEANRTGERPGHDAIASVLFHVHLPNFADAGVLDYDTRHLDVHYDGDPRLEEVFEKIRELE